MPSYTDCYSRGKETKPLILQFRHGAMLPEMLDSDLAVDHGPSLYTFWDGPRHIFGVQDDRRPTCGC